MTKPTLSPLSSPKFARQRRYHRYVSGFEDFLSKDHEVSMDILARAEEKSKLSRELTNTRNQLFREFGQVRLDVYQWEENWRMVKMCQRFLYQVSPISWRQEHDWIHRSKSGECTVSVEDLFGRYRMADEVASLSSLIGDPLLPSVLASVIYQWNI